MMYASSARLPKLEELHGLKVTPGDPLCTIEEFMPGEGVYVDDSGVIRAARVGIVELDMVSRRIRVRLAVQKPRLPSKGDQVYAILTSVPREDLALFRIFADERGVPYSGSFSGILHISQASDTMIKSMYDVVKPGDIVRATVISSTAPYMLSMKRPQDGVVLANCSICSAPLYKVPGRNVLVCLRCGNVEKRKVSSNYILVHKKKSK